MPSYQDYYNRNLGASRPANSSMQRYPLGGYSSDKIGTAYGGGPMTGMGGVYNQLPTGGVPQYGYPVNGLSNNLKQPQMEVGLPPSTLQQLRSRQNPTTTKRTSLAPFQQPEGGNSFSSLMQAMLMQQLMGQSGQMPNGSIRQSTGMTMRRQPMVPYYPIGM